jgi:hypothetical protein
MMTPKHNSRGAELLLLIAALIFNCQVYQRRLMNGKNLESVFRSSSPKTAKVEVAIGNFMNF